MPETAPDRLLRHDVRHRIYVVRVSDRRMHWRQAHHGQDHDARVFTGWIVRSVTRRQDTITNSLKVEFLKHGVGDADFITNRAAWRGDIRVISHGVAQGLPQWLSVPESVAVVETVLP